LSRASASCWEVHPEVEAKLASATAIAAATGHAHFPPIELSFAMIPSRARKSGKHTSDDR
jgi:hypothetical protein